MPIIIEDGTLVEGANSYISVQDLKDYAALRGITLPADDQLTSKLILAMDYLDKYNPQWPGTPKGELGWPREGAGYEGIPTAVKKAQTILAVKAVQGTALFNDTTADTKVLKSKKVDVLEWEYAVSETDPTIAPQPVFPEVDAILESIFAVSGWYGRTEVRRA